MTSKLFKPSVLALACFFSLAACQSTAQSSNEEKTLTTSLMFTESLKEFPREEKNLREWDTPVVADLDQDGYPDLLLNDHGFSIRVMWNNKGTYAKPYDLIMGDMHGISVADFDHDGNLELIISRGGGSGSNARNSIIYRVDNKRNFTIVPDFKVPLAFMRGRTVKFFDGDNDGDLDLLNFAFPAGNKKDQSENYVYENNAKGQLAVNNMLPPSKVDGQKILVTDFNGDNIADLFMYGHNSVIVYQGQGDLTFKDVTKTVLASKYYDVNGIAEIDYDNDGDFDIVLTRGKEFTAGETFFDSNTKRFGFYTKRGEFTFEGLVAGDVLNIQNLQTQWPNKALYLGESAYEYIFPGETHSGRDVRLVNSDTLGFPDKYTKNGTYLGYVGNNQWRLGINMFSPATGVIEGITSYPDYKHEAGLTDILLENRNGKFVDVSKSANLTLAEHTTGVAVADIDNNGFQDLVILKRGNLITANESIVYLNNGNKSFNQHEVNGLLSPELGAIGMGIEPVDFNKDGKIDFIQGNERGKWHLFKNTFATAQSNNHLIVKVGKAESNKVSALGALVKVKACENSQIKRVGSTGASYSLSFDQNVHFGLGTCDKAAEVTVTWSNNESKTITTTKVNNEITIGLFD